MSVLDELVQAITASSKMDAGTKAVVTAVLRIGGPGMEALGPEALREVMGALAGGERGAAVEAMAESLSEAQVAAMLDATQSAMNAAVADQAARKAAAQAAIASMEQAALSVVMQAIIGAL